MQDQNRYILTGFSLVEGSDAQAQPRPEAIAIAGDRIVAVGDRAQMPAFEQCIDLQGKILAPGFIDLQLNGCGGVQLNNDIATRTLDVMHQTNLRFGCTSFLPTLITSSDDDIRDAVALVQDYRQSHPARVPGLHLEGPFLNMSRKGIHDRQWVREPSSDIIRFLCDHADTIAMVTLAPEICGNDVIRQLSEAGIVVALGHTNATCAEAKATEQAGARFATHLHNAMSPVTGREAGVVGAVLDSHLMGAGIIADGHHVCWENLRIAHRLMQDRLVLVTDATAAAGSDIPEFEFGGQTVYQKDGLCTNSDGTLGGSALTMIEAVVNSINHGIEPDAAFRMATVNAARAIHVEDRMGSVSEGLYANLVILDKDFSVQGTVSAGAIQRI